MAQHILQAQTKIWAHHTGDTSVNGDYANEIRFDNNGNTIVCGSFHGNIHLDPNNMSSTLTSNGSSDSYIAKYNPAGNLLFQLKITGPAYETIYAMDLDNAGNIFVTGTFASTMDLDPSSAIASFTSYGNSSDIFIAKYDANGNYKWGKSVGSVGNTDNGLGLCVDNQNSVIVTGHFTGSVSFASGNTSANKTSLGGMDAFIVKYDSAGNFNWVNTIGSAPHWERGKKIICDNNNNLYVTGEFSSTIDVDPSAIIMNISPIGGTDGDIFIIKYNAYGLPQWAKSIGVAGQFDVEPSVCVYNNYIYLAGYAQDSLDFNLNVGNSYLPISNYYKMYVAKYDQNMQIIWAKQFQDSSYSTISNIQFDQQANIVLSGEFKNYNAIGFDFDLSNSNFMLNVDSNTFHDLFVARYDSNLNFKNVFQIRQSKYGYITSQDIDPNNDVVVCGNFKDTIDLDPTLNNTMAYSNGESDIFFGKYAFVSPNALQDVYNNISIEIFPNPVKDLLYINNDKPLQYQIFNAMGQQLKQGNAIHQINVQHLPKGIYILSLQSNFKNYTAQFVKE